MKQFCLSLLTLCLMFQTLTAASTLEKMSARLRTYHSISMAFTFTGGLGTMPSQPVSGGWPGSEEGTLQVMGGKFKLHLPQMDILSDGTHAYQYLPGAGEINMTAVSESAEVSLTTRPDLLLTEWDKYFQVMPMKETEGKDIQAFTLLPKEEGSFFKAVVLWINKEDQMPVMLCAMMGDGSITGMSITRLEDNKELKDNDFKFDLKNYPKGTELIDMTF